MVEVEEGHAGDAVDPRWTLRAADRTLLGNKSGATRLGFAVLLKLFAAEGRFPRRPEEVAVAAVEAIAAQVSVPAAAWRGYNWHGRAIRVSGVAAPHSPGLADRAALRRWTVRGCPGLRLTVVGALVRMIVGAHKAAAHRP